jgi:hypothetical protein
MNRTARLERHTELRPTRWGIAPKPARRKKKRVLEGPYVDFVKSLPCIHCGARAPSEPAHMTLSKNEKGTGLKVRDRQCVPLCAACHDFWDGRAGRRRNGVENPFLGIVGDARFEHAAKWVDDVNRWYHAAFQVPSGEIHPDGVPGRSPEPCEGETTPGSVAGKLGS